MSVGSAFEVLFNVTYLCLVLSAGFGLLVKGRGGRESTVFALMCLILGFGDCFHLAPRSYKILFGDSPRVTAAVGLGNLITAFGMTIFYVLFLEVIGLHYKKDVKYWRIPCCRLFILRAVALLLPQNDWIHNHFDLTISLVRNTPFVILGVIVTCLLFAYSQQREQDPFKFMWVYVTVSFACYLPVALIHFGDYRDAVLMIVKTIAYLCIVFTGFNHLCLVKDKEMLLVFFTMLYAVIHNDTPFHTNTQPNSRPARLKADARY